MTWPPKEDNELFSPKPVKSKIDKLRAAYPRVSTIIGIQTAEAMGKIPKEILDAACTRGTKVHEYCTAWLLHLWTPDIENEYQPYVDSFCVWGEKNVRRCLHTGLRLFDDSRAFTGEIDAIVELDDGSIALIDLKTSSQFSKSWPIQLAAYRHLCQVNGIQIDKIFNIHLKKVVKKEKGEIAASPFSVLVDSIQWEDLSPFWDIFSSALNCFDYFGRKDVISSI